MDLFGHQALIETKPLRDYQIALRGELTEAGVEHRRILVQLWMGTGKTLLAAHMGRDAARKGYRVLFLAHRRELVSQSHRTFREDAGAEASMMISGDEYDPTNKIVVASLQTLHSWSVRRKKMVPPPADLVFIDECQHSGSKSWVEIAELYPEAYIVGLTATPKSKGGKGLAAHYDKLICGPSMQWFIERKYLVPVRYVVPHVPDLSRVKIGSDGDYQEGELEKAMDHPKLVGDVVSNWFRFAQGKRTLVYASGVRHSQHIVSVFKEAGIAAAHVDAKTPKHERDHVYADFKSGKVMVLANDSIYTEGTDFPCAEALAMCRPSRSETLYLQICGRIMRPYPGKDFGLVLDHSGAVYEHGRVDAPREWSLTYNKPNKGAERKIKERRKRKSIICQAVLKDGNKCLTYYEPAERKSMMCPACGHTPEIKGKSVATLEAWLTVLGDDDAAVDQSPESKRLWYLGLLHHAKQRGWKKGWAAHAHRRKWGTWPGTTWRSMAPVAPGAELRAWLREDTARYWASRKQTAGAAF